MKLRYHASVLFIIFVVAILLFWLPGISRSLDLKIDNTTVKTTAQNNSIVISNRYIAKHIQTPINVRGLYLSGWGAGNTTIKDRVIKMITDSQLSSDTSLNSVVIDVKDYTGLISFKLDKDMIDDNHKYDNGDMSIFEINNTSNKIANIKKLIEDLHNKNIYVIGRIAVFQDPYMPKYKSEVAIKVKENNTKSEDIAWKDKKGLTWVNPNSEQYWKYIVNLSKYTYDIGFDEVNLDYIRYPTDGNVDNMDLGLASGTTKYETINSFYEYVGEELRDYVPVSADLFGLTTMSKDDMGIGQKIESGLINFDFVAPMIYPSHYGAGFKGMANPDANPYSTIRLTMIEADKKVKALSSNTDESSEVYWSKMRPWIQDFSLHTAYGINEVDAQIRALRELGINSYLIWNASNVYTRGVKY